MLRKVIVIGLLLVICGLLYFELAKWRTNAKTQIEGVAFEAVAGSVSSKIGGSPFLFVEDMSGDALNVVSKLGLSNRFRFLPLSRMAMSSNGNASDRLTGAAGVVIFIYRVELGLEGADVELAYTGHGRWQYHLQKQLGVWKVVRRQFIAIGGGY